MVYVAFNDHLLVGTCIMTNVNAEFNANRAKTAPSRNFDFYIEKANDAMIMTSQYNMYDLQ